MSSPKYQDRSYISESEASDDGNISASSLSSFQNHRAKFKRLLGRMDDLRAFKNGIIKQNETVVSD